MTIPAPGTIAQRRRTLTTADIALFTELTGDRNPLHLDPAAAAASRFGGLIVQGGVTSGLLNALVAEDLPGPGSVFLQVDWSFRAPGRPGQTITAEAQVLTRHPDKPIATLRTTVTADDGTVLIDGTAVVYREPLGPLRAPDPGHPLEATDPHCLSEAQTAVLLQNAPWRRLAVLGDSLAEGLGDPVPGYRTASWADRLAQALRAATGSGTDLNLGRRGATAAAVGETQLPPALAFGPDLAVLTAGANDLLRPGYDPAALCAELEILAGTLAGRGALVVTFGLFDLTRAEPRDGLRRKLIELNRMSREVTERHGGVHLDFFDHPVVEEGLLSRDRLHPNHRAHARIASEIIRALSNRRYG